VPTEVIISPEEFRTRPHAASTDAKRRPWSAAGIGMRAYRRSNGAERPGEIVARLGADPARWVRSGSSGSVENEDIKKRRWAGVAIGLEPGCERRRSASRSDVEGIDHEHVLDRLQRPEAALRWRLRGLARHSAGA